MLYHLILFGNFRKFGMGFFGGGFLVQGFFGVLLEALGIFLGFDFCLHSIIPITQNLEYPPWDKVLLSSKICFNISIHHIPVGHPLPFLSTGNLHLLHVAQ